MNNKQKYQDSSCAPEKGFTLIELLVVVSIIGVLATIVLSSLSKARDRSKEAFIKSALRQMQTQAELQYLETGDYSTVCDVGTRSYEIFEEAQKKSFVPISGSFPLDICIDENSSVDNFSNSNELSTGTPSPTIADSNGSTWAAHIRLSNGSVFCVDSLGTLGEFTGGSNGNTIGAFSSNDRTCD